MFVDLVIDVVYIVILYFNYYEFIMKSLYNGKYVLVEKVIIVSSEEFNEINVLVKEKGLIVKEVMIIFYMLFYKKL